MSTNRSELLRMLTETQYALVEAERQILVAPDDKTTELLTRQLEELRRIVTILEKKLEFSPDQRT